MDTCSVRGDTVSQTNVLYFARINVVYLPELGGQLTPRLVRLCLSYISSTSHCLMEMCPVLHQLHFSVFDGDVPCPTPVTLIIVWWRCAPSYISSTSHCLMEMCPVLHKFHFSLFDGDVPCPTSVILLSVWWRCAMPFTSSTSQYSSLLSVQLPENDWQHCCYHFGNKNYRWKMQINLPSFVFHDLLAFLQKLF